MHGLAIADRSRVVQFVLLFVTPSHGFLLREYSGCSWTSLFSSLRTLSMLA